MPAPFAVTLYTRDYPVRLVVVGELDTATAPELETTFRWVAAAHDAANVQIDVSALEFCDSGGWRALAWCRDQGAELHGSPPCLRRLSISSDTRTCCRPRSTSCGDSRRGRSNAAHGPPDAGRPHCRDRQSVG